MTSNDLCENSYHCHFSQVLLYTLTSLESFQYFKKLWFTVCTFSILNIDSTFMPFCWGPRQGSLSESLHSQTWGDPPVIGPTSSSLPYWDMWSVGFFSEWGVLTPLHKHSIIYLELCGNIVNWATGSNYILLSKKLKQINDWEIEYSTTSKVLEAPRPVLLIFICDLGLMWNDPSVFPAIRCG